MRAGFPTSSYLAVDEHLQADASRPRGARPHAPVRVMNERSVEPTNPTLSLSYHHTRHVRYLPAAPVDSRRWVEAFVRLEDRLETAPVSRIKTVKARSNEDSQGQIE